MDGQMNEWDGWVDGWMDGCMGWMDGWMNGWTDASECITAKNNGSMEECNDRIY